MTLTLHTYWRSSTAYRVRIALNLKGLPFDSVPVHLVKGEHKADTYTRLNPQGILPTLVTDEGLALTQSLAICEWLEETCPTPAILPPDAAGRARVRAFAQAIACEIHPITNLRVLKHLTGEMGVSEEAKLAWYRHWVAEGLAPLEAMVADSPATGRFVQGDTPTLADICLVPQMYNARRFEVDLGPYPTLRRLDEAARGLKAFADAAPEAQPDAT